MQTIQIGKKYNYFGAKPPKPRLRSDLQWDHTDKIDQYKCIEKIFQLNFDLERTKHESDFKEKRQMLGELDQKIKEKQLKLNDLRAGDFHKIKNLLKDHNEPINPQKPQHKIIEDSECKLFDKRKELDRLRYEENKLCNAYEHKLKQLAEKQDRQKYTESCQMADETKVKHLEYLLGNADIQIQSYENFLNDCESIINRLTEESLHYTNILNSLEREVNEQNQILNLINKMGMPAYESARKNKKRLETMEKRLFNETSKRQATISQYKHNLLTNEQHIFKHLPKDEQIKAIIPDRYIQETSSVLAARKHYETVENDTKELCDAAACADTNELYSTVQEIYSKFKAGNEKVVALENQLVEMDDEINKAKQVKDSLSYSVKVEDIEVTRQIEKVNEQISLDAQTKKLIASKTETFAGELFKIQFAMQHLVDLVRNVNGERPVFRKEYPNEILSLPLFELHLETYEDTTQPPETIEEDIDKLFKALYDRIKLLMAEYSRITVTSDFKEDCEKRQMQLVLQELSQDSPKS